MSILNLNGPAGRSPRGKRAVKVWMGIGLVIAVLGVGSTLASTITINGGTNKEFGQGVQRTVYCGGNKQITVTPVSSYLNVAEPMPNESESSRSESESESATPSASALAGTFYLSGIKVSEIPKECSGVDFVFSVYNQRGDSTPIVISTLAGEGDITTPTVFWYDNPEVALPNYGGLLSSSRDTYAPATAQMELIVLPRVEGKGSFTIKFKDPIGTTHALIDDVGRVIIETQNDTFWNPIDLNLITPLS
jgi:hypothetical protein